MSVRTDKASTSPPKRPAADYRPPSASAANAASASIKQSTHGANSQSGEVAVPERVPTGAGTSLVLPAKPKVKLEDRLREELNIRKQQARCIHP
jgi:hypothetical protein